jgi:hypothetical protein
MFLVASVLVPATALAAGTGSLSISPATVTTTTGSTFTVSISSSATNSMAGAAAAVDFDSTKLQIISVSRGADWNVAGVTWVEPTVSDIATANSTGHLPPIAAYYQSNVGSLPANTPAALATVTFFATATGTSTISLPIAGNKGAIIDGDAATRGDPVLTTGGSTSVTTTQGAAQNGQVTASISGSVAAPRLALTCPASVPIPLVRNATNQAPFTCDVSTDGAWTLSVKDTNPGPNHGHMVDSSQTPVAVLANSLHVHDPSSDVDLAAGPGPDPVSSGSAGTTVPLTLTQVVNPGDKPGAYGISVLFSVVNTF